MGSDFTLPEAEEPCDSARIQLCEAAGPGPGRPDRSDFTLPEAEEPCDSARTQLCDTARPGPGRPDRSELPLPEAEEPCDSARTQLRKAAEAGPDLPKVGLYVDTGIGQPIQDRSCLEWQEAEARLPGTARAHTCKTAAFYHSSLWLRKVAEQEPEDTEAGHLLDFVRIQTVTRGTARKAAQDESPLSEQMSTDLLAMIRELQGSDPLCLRLKKELGTDSSRDGYFLDQDGLLQYQGRVVVPAQKALTQELLFLYYNNQLTRH